MRKFFVAALAATLPLAPATAQQTLTSGPGDGGVTVNVNAAGTATSTGDYDPVGIQLPASTIYRSELFFRQGDSGRRQSVGDGTVLAETFDGTTYSSQLSFTDTFGVVVSQSVTSLFAADGVTRTGSLLQQSYDFVNLGASSIVLDIVRYVDGDLYFDGSIADGGGRLNVGGRDFLFETDNDTNAGEFTTFFGIYNEGGVTGGYEIADYGSLLAGVRRGDALRNVIDGDNDGDGFVDNRYDLGLAQQNLLTVDARRTARFSTYTLFGSGTPDAVQVPGAVPEPATWAMMIGGFGLVGSAMRRRRPTVTFA